MERTRQELLIDKDIGGLPDKKTVKTRHNPVLSFPQNGYWCSQTRDFLFVRTGCILQA